MKERPILFSAPMVRAILDGAKTQTRRIVKPQPVEDRKFRSGFRIDCKNHSAVSTDAPGGLLGGFCRYGGIGNRLWVRETWRTHGDAPLSECTGPADVDFRADADEVHDAISHWRPSIFMPRWASRILLEVTWVRVQRLHDISEDDARTEGAPSAFAPTWYSARYGSLCGSQHLYGFVELWATINGIESWNANPWVWALSFKRVGGDA